MNQTTHVVKISKDYLESSQNALKQRVPKQAKALYQEQKIFIHMNGADIIIHCISLFFLLPNYLTNEK